MMHAPQFVFIAQGIGVTPFRSMIKHMIDMDKTASIVMFYIAKTEKEFFFTDLFNQAETKGFLKTIYSIGKPLQESLLKKYIKNLESAIFYISGPQAVVEFYRNMLIELAVPQEHIKTDLFTGYEESKSIVE